MEDAWAVHQPLGADFAFCGIFDGHGGAHAAHFCRDNLHFNVMAASSFYSGRPKGGAARWLPEDGGGFNL